MKKAVLLAVAVMGSILFIVVNSIQVSAAGKPDKGKPITSVNLPRTGSTYDNPAAIGDDAELQVGVQWPVPRFVDNLDGTVTDRLTKLVWLKNVTCLGSTYWIHALELCNTLQSGMCGLTDDSVQGDWRLPNRNELSSLYDASPTPQGIPDGHPFINLFEGKYWTSTIAASNFPAEAWYVSFYDGRVQYEGAVAGNNYAWPVRSSK